MSGTTGRWRRVRALLRKELQEIRRNKSIVATMAWMPIVMVGLLVAFNAVATHFPDQDPISGGFNPPQQLAALGGLKALRILVNDQLIFYLLLTPMLIPTLVASYSVIGEKQARTLEPLLATPIRTWEMLLAKCLGAALPAALIGWVSYLLAVAGIWISAGWPMAAHAMRPLWLLGILLLSPLLAVLSTLMALVISARSSDVRSAQGFAGLINLPLLIGVSMVLVKKVYLTVHYLPWIVGGVLLIDLLLLPLAVRLFRREVILTRWR